MSEHIAHSGAWGLAAIMVVVASWVLYRYLAPKSWREWASAGVVQAFIIALYAEMYGFPLTIYLFSGWLQSRFPETDFLSHDAGHRWNSLIGWDINPHFDPLHLLSNLVIIINFVMLASAWRILHAAQRKRELAIQGIYARLRHPRYAAFILIMIGFLLQWPTLPTLIMFPVLVYAYVRLARSEEQASLEEFGNDYRAYKARTPAFIPLRRTSAVSSTRSSVV